MSGHSHATLPSLSVTPDTSHDAPPPPPLPPPPPGAPPPPPPPPAMFTTHNLRKKRRVRSFFWKPIPEEKVRGKPNIWTMAVRQQHYQIDVRSVEELFGQQEEVGIGARGAVQAAGPSTGVFRSRSFKDGNKDGVSGWHPCVTILSPKIFSVPFTYSMEVVLCMKLGKINLDQAPQKHCWAILVQWPDLTARLWQSRTQNAFLPNTYITKEFAHWYNVWI